MQGEVGSQRHGEDGGALGVEVDGIRLVIVSRQNGRVHGDQSFHASPSRGQGHFMDCVRRPWSGRDEDDQFRAIGLK